jgi:thiamine biosynthesis protein ThiS
MRIILNGEPRDVADSATVLGVLEGLGFNPEGTVVERNADILDRASYATTALAEGDTVELVRFVGGG